MDFRLNIIAESPLSFSQNKPGGIFQNSLSYIPGSALRGALAARLLNGPYAGHKDHHFEEGCDFCQVFLGPGAAVFSNAYPAHAPEDKVQVLPEAAVSDNACPDHAPEDEVQVLPATAVSCKQKKGFKPSSHGIFDTLIDRLCCEELEPVGLVYSPTCPVCLDRVEAYGGFYVYHNHCEHADHYHERKVDQRLLTRVAINRRRMVAEEGLLFSPYVISEVVERDRHDPGEQKDRYRPTAFVGHVWGLPEELESWLGEMTSVGGRTSRGLGHVRIKPKRLDGRASGPGAIQQRIKALDGAIEDVWKQYQRLGGNGSSKEGLYFTLTLRSDAALCTLEGLPTMVFDEKMLKQATGIEAELVRSYASYGYSGGWQSAWGLPKPAQVLSRCGSVYVYRAKGGLTLADYQALAKLEWQGIGELTPEGYGQVRVADAFHLKRRGPNER